MISLQHCRFILNKHYTLQIDTLNISKGSHTAVVGANGSGKSALAAVLAGEGYLEEGQFEVSGNIGWVSVEQQKRLIEQERQKDDADILDVIPTPTLTKEVILAETDLSKGQSLFARLCDIFRLTPLLSRPFLALSTGETRKVLIAKTLLAFPDIVVLDEPWDGLDTEATQGLQTLLEQYSRDITIILVLNRLSELPAYVQKILYLENGSISWQSSGSNIGEGEKAHLDQLLRMSHVNLFLPAKDEDKHSPELKSRDLPLVILNDGQVKYGDNVIFRGLDWQVNPGQHWQIIGPNGSGKTCLLTMLTGDNPHCYTNDLQIFGYQRGSGESIWDIKQHIGYVSNALHMQYRVNCSLHHVILSGFYDSIGLYEQPTARQKQLAREWLTLIALERYRDTPFQQLSFGDQRLALIARAMVKHPALLILDEPCNGLDELNRLKVLALISLLAREGNTTLLYVNHHQEDVIEGIEQVLDMQKFHL
ncbi:molybdate ABC transporter ATP-binding protein ModF [Alteromonas pelagimontana]|uniref:Molybdate ABC transporter ATP-binding protein ModF n=1 Tax=Alteromonas pelagimontana TaxID=1858656 RepID=A0A6M4MA34_9ALTE|nr:molybdate ABC transporter ATP-binding protein ModF [Alteromonas pelagimontana]QJR80034.1 molybdate ABC transporter ATP-binding protein ModF [Alteromonas pelagimontana]